MAIPLPYKVGLIGALAFLVSLGGFWLYNHVWDKGWEAHKIKIEAATATILAKHAAELIEKGIQYDKNQITINRLAADAKRVRVKFPNCPSIADPADTGVSSGILPVSVDSAFADFQEEVGILIERCDALNNAAIRANPN